MMMMDLESQFLEEGAPQVMVSRRKVASSKSGVWRVCGVLLTVALCAAGAVCFTLNKVTILTKTYHYKYAISGTYQCIIVYLMLRFLFILVSEQSGRWKW